MLSYPDLTPLTFTRSSESRGVLVAVSCNRSAESARRKPETVGSTCNAFGISITNSVTMNWHVKLLAWASLISLVSSSCYEPSPAFPVPTWENGAQDLSHAFQAIESKISEIVNAERFDTSSFSIELTSNTQTLWSHFHTAKKQNETRPGDRNVDRNSVYRIASITKVFTTLAIFYAVEAGKLHLDDPISKYVPELAGEIPWNDITLRILASQLSGIPREFAQGDLMNLSPDAIASTLR